MESIYLIKRIIKTSKIENSFNKSIQMLLLDYRISHDYIMEEITEDDYKNFCEIKKNYPEKIYRASDIKLEPEHKVIDSSSREGFYILKCDSREEAKRLAQL